jgi:uncharacterized lipoprotein YddW (UPF0748 family)
MMTTLFRVLIALALVTISACASVNSPSTSPPAFPPTSPVPEVRGTWITTTANTAISTPQNTAKTMKRLREIGLNTVYVEVWKNGYTQFPSEALNKMIGTHTRPNFFPQDPSDGPDQQKLATRDLLQETLIEAHRNGLITIAWFEYGFMAAYKTTNPHLRRMKPELLSRDINGNEVAPNGFVWLNPLHPEARQFLLDIVLEAVDKYDLDGVQLDDRIVWPYITMGYDDYTKKVYAREHNGMPPPADHTNPEWMRWRADKVNEYARMFVQEVRAKRPGLLVSLSPAVYPWSWEYYLLEWPKWAAWTERDRVGNVSNEAKNMTPRWDEFIPQAYRFSYDAFEKTWLEQNEHVKALGANRTRDLLAGIRVVGDGKDSSWEQLRDSISLTRKLGNAGHVLWFSRGVLDLYPQQLTEFYGGEAPSPQFPRNWRKQSISLFRAPGVGAGIAGEDRWFHPDIPRGKYRMIGFDGKTWRYLEDQPLDRMSGSSGEVYFFVRGQYREVELVVDRREEMMKPRRPLL